MILTYEMSAYVLASHPCPPGVYRYCVNVSEVPGISNRLIHHPRLFDRIMIVGDVHAETTSVNP